MSIMLIRELLVLLIVFVLSFCGTWVYRRYALRRALLDLPNARSSHTQPTPRGGGIAILVSFCIGLFMFAHAMMSRAEIGLLSATFLLALISYYDDLGHVAARWRLLAQALAVVLVLWGLALLFSIAMPHWSVSIMLVLSLMWLINLYNFMDGINGLAAFTGVIVAGLLGLLLWQQGAPPNIYWPPLLLASASAGFLYWNFPRAIIFMGDIGSCFIGLVFGYIAVTAGLWNSLFYWVALILMGCFIVDASLTLAKRGWRRQRIYEAHREHAYQHLARRWRSHTSVTLLYMAITIGWLFPCAVLLLAVQTKPVIVLGLAYIPLLIGFIRAGAGSEEQQAQS